METEVLRGKLNQLYDQSMYSPLVNEFYAGSDFHNAGYWTPTTRTPREAGENLVEKLLTFLPNRTGVILDIACGKGASTAYLLKYFRPQSVIGVNISLKQLETARQNAPGARFMLSDASSLAFADGSVDHVLCVEAAMHFQTRERFLHEVVRVLRPGGRLVLSDILVRPRVAKSQWRVPPENHLDSPADYRTVCERAGLRDVQVIEATRECLHSYHRAMLRFAHEKASQGAIDAKMRRRITAFVMAGTLACKHYVLVAGAKP